MPGWQTLFEIYGAAVGGAGAGSLIKWSSVRGRAYRRGCSDMEQEWKGIVDDRVQRQINVLQSPSTHGQENHICTTKKCSGIQSPEGPNTAPEHSEQGWWNSGQHSNWNKKPDDPDAGPDDYSWIHS